MLSKQFLIPISAIILLIFIGSINRINSRGLHWEFVFEELQDQISENFVVNTLSYFAGWRLHQGGTLENTLLAAKQLNDWREWGWPIVRTVNFSVRFPRGPPSKGPLNEVFILERSSQAIQHRVKNYVEFKCTDSQPHGNKTCSGNETLTVPTYCGFARSGNATGRPLFVNYATLGDLRFFSNASSLCSLDVVVLARNGGLSYGSKLRNIIRFCEKSGNGTLPGGIIIFNDPADSNPQGVKAFPNGIGLPSDGIKFRVSTMWKSGGDPETPGLPSVEGVYRSHTVEETAVTPIPLQTISFDDAKVILSGMSGNPIPDKWKPCAAKFLGPEGNTLIRMEVRNHIEETPSQIVDVVGIMPGSGPEATQYVTVGNHRDAWIQGASDPHSGTVVLHGIAYLLGLAHKLGWRPRRTILIASWDAEEVGLFGSTEFTELYRNELINQAVVHINQDCPVKGNASFAPRSDELLADALLFSARAARGPCDPPPTRSSEGWPPTIFDTFPLGGSTDHVPFQYHLGIPSTYVEFRPELPLFEAPSYHTAYDSLTMAMNFTDPACSSTNDLLPLHRYLIRLHFHLILQFSSARRLPIYPTRKATTLKKTWNSIIQQNRRLLPDLENLYGIKLDYITDEIEDFLNAANSFEESIQSLHVSDYRCLRVFNDLLGRLSRQFIINENNRFMRHTLVDDSYTDSHQASYFPKVRALMHKLTKGSPDNSQPVVKSLKRELSHLLVSFKSASNLLRGGLLGSLDALLLHACSPTARGM